jgi:ABC-type multidrug transport system ATPase subunit
MPSFYAVAVVFLVVLGLSAEVLKVTTDRMFARRRSVIGKGVHAHSPLAGRRHESGLVMEDVDFAYGNKHVITDLDFSLLSPETAVLTGISGAGKTTFAKLAAGLLTPQKGTIRVPQNACIIFQDDLLLPHLDCYGNASLPARCRRLPDTASRTLFALDACGLADSVHAFPDELSGGMKKRLAFARALVFDPDFIILDEPFNNLHKEARDELWDLYVSLFTERGIPSVIITHFPEELVRYAHFARLVLEHGSIIRTGSVTPGP